MSDQFALEMHNISKRFPGVCALDCVDLVVKKGEVHAVVGENGAGKSTLMKVLCGAYHMDSGNILINGEEVFINHPLDAQRLGIATIYQEFNLAPHLSVQSNIFIGREPTKRLFGWIDENQIFSNTNSLFKQLGVEVEPSKEIRNLSVSQQQFTEIAKALSMNPKILIMDEPTSALPEKEIQQLFKVIRRIKNEGVTILYISHCLDEVFEIADSITVLRDGKHILTKPKEELTKEEVITQIVGIELAKIQRPKKHQHDNQIAMRVEHLYQGEKLRDISFELYKGEILGIAGLLGAGRTELLCCLFGINHKTSGKISIDGRLCEIEDPSDAIKLGMGYVPEDRKMQGLYLGLSTRANILATYIRFFFRKFIVDQQKEKEVADHHIQTMNIKVYSQEQIVLNLSGGNQQKVLLGRWLSMNPKILLLDDPTRGIDVGARTSIHQLIFKLAEKGLSVIFVSSELPEVMDVCDRILVMARGQITGEYSRDEATKEKIMSCATLSRANHIIKG